MRPAAPIQPGATIGLLGGGQLGRMTALAARAMGYDIRVLDPDKDCPARPVASVCITAPFDDVKAVTELARGSDVLTIGSIRSNGSPRGDSRSASTTWLPRRTNANRSSASWARHT